MPRLSALQATNRCSGENCENERPGGQGDLFLRGLNGNRAVVCHDGNVGVVQFSGFKMKRRTGPVFGGVADAESKYGQ
jgi:hypothetical protein